MLCTRAFSIDGLSVCPWRGNSRNMHFRLHVSAWIEPGYPMLAHALRLTCTHTSYVRTRMYTPAHLVMRTMTMAMATSTMMTMTTVTRTIKMMMKMRMRTRTLRMVVSRRQKRGRVIRRLKIQLAGIFLSFAAPFYGGFRD